MTVSMHIDRIIVTSDDEIELDKLPHKQRTIQSFRRAKSHRNAANDFISKACALFYGLASFVLTVVTKSVLTAWQFSSFLVI